MTGGIPGGVPVRRGVPADFGAVLSVWRASDEARGIGHPPPPDRGERLRAVLQHPSSFLFVAERAEGAENIVGMAVGMQGLADDGAGPPVEGLCHVAAVFVAPDLWGQGVGGRLVDAVLTEARSRGYARAQLWTHADNGRAQRLYENRGFGRTGREKEDDANEAIVHYQKRL